MSKDDEYVEYLVIFVVFDFESKKKKCKCVLIKVRSEEKIIVILERVVDILCNVFIVMF